MVRAFFGTFPLIAVLALVGATTAHAQEWQHTDGAARDVGVGADGTVWVIGTNAVPGGYGIYKRTNNAWENVPGGAERIAVAPGGNAWVVNNAQSLLRYNGTKWLKVNRSARDVGVGANGTVWVIGNEAEEGGYAIYRSTDRGVTWTKIPGGAVRVSVDPQGNAWVVNNSNNILRHDGTKWVPLVGAATDVGIGADGQAWVIGTDNGIYRWEGSNWAKKPGGAAQIAAGPNGAVWIVNPGNQIFRAAIPPAAGQAVAATAPAQPTAVIIPTPVLQVSPPTTSTPSEFAWTRTEGGARDVGVGADGTVWVIGTNAVQGGYGIYKRTNNTWTNVPGGAERIAVDPRGNAWVVNNTQNIFRHDGSKWITVNGAARDVGVGANGTVWVIGNNAEAGGYGIYRSTDQGASWTKVPGSALRISVDPQGNAWVVNNSNTIFRHDGSNWVQLPGAATDVGIGADGQAWVIGTDNGIYRWEGSNWARKPGGAAQIAAGPNGAVWIVNQGGEIYQAQATAPASTQVASSTVTAPSGTIVLQGTTSIPVTGSPTVTSGTVVAVPGTTSTTATGTLVVGGAGTTGLTTGTAAAPPPPVHDPNRPWIVFARGYTYEAQILQAIGFQRFKSLVFLGNAIPAANQLSPLEQTIADIALTATESYFAPNPLPPDQAIAKVRNDITARRGVITFIGMGISARVRTNSSDARTVALRQWAAEVFRVMQVTTAKGVLDEYNRWQRDPCGYENLPAIRCTGYSGAISAPRPPQDLIQKNGLGAALAGTADEVAAAAAVGFAAAGLGASAAALATGLGVTAIAATTVTAGTGALVTIPAVSTSLFAAFGGVASTATAVGAATGGAATTSAAASSAAAGIGSVSWAGVVAAPVAAAVAVVVVGTVEGFAVVEAARVEPMLKLKLGAAMTEDIVIQNELTTDAGKDFFLLAYEGVAAGNFNIPPNTVDGEVRYFCQAGYVCRFKLAYQVDGASQSKQTQSLSVGHEESFPIPARATNIVASGEWWNGSSWQSLFSRDLPRPTFIGFTAYGTIFDAKYKDEYPEISNIQPPANTLTVTHGGGYVAWIRVEYNQGGSSVRKVENSSTSAGWRQEVDIPSDATNIHLIAWSATGWVGEPWKTIIDKTWSAPQGVCIKLYGTTLDPKWNNECR